MINVKVHGCALGLTSIRFPTLFVKKPWTIATTSKEIAGILSISPAQDLIPKFSARFRIHESFSLESREGVGVEYLSPLVRVVP
jgi:hypothetical protein